MIHGIVSSRLAFVLLLGFTAIGVVGCSSRPKNVAKEVKGKVTLGGQPLADAFITFTPKDGGSPSFGSTNAAGEYVLIWAQKRGTKIEGAQIGEHLVRITTAVEADSGADPPVVAVPEKVPFKYRQDGGNPTVTVKKGSNNIDIALDPGPVEDPAITKSKAKGKAGRRPNVEE